MKKLLILLFYLSLSFSPALAAEQIQSVSSSEQIVNKNYSVNDKNLAYRNVCFANAVIRGDIDLAKTFIQSGYDVNATYGSVPVIFFPVQKNNNEMLKLLLDSGANPNSIYLSTSVAMLALEKENNMALEMLLQYGADVNSDNGSPLLLTAIYLKNIDAVRILLKHNADVNKIVYNKRPINLAIQKKRADIVELFLQNGAKSDDDTAKLLVKSNAPQMKLLFQQYK
jgi:ankyrin repeat protein